MEINTKYHGIREYKEEDVIFFKKGLPGFENLKKFILFPVEGNDVFNILQSLEDSAVGLVTIVPFDLMESYELKLGDNLLEELGITKEEEVLVLNTVTLSSKVENITVNLKAPIIINIVNKTGEQIILDKNEYSIKHPLLQR